MPARRIRGAAAAAGGGGGEGTPSLTAPSSSSSAVETTAPAPPYTPSPMDASLIAPQLFALVFILGAAAYLQVFVTGTARARFDKADPARRAFVETDGGESSEPGWVERELARKGGTRPRGDRTKGGTVIPGVGDAPEWMRRGEDDELDS